MEIVFGRGKKILSYVIAYFEGFPVSHCALRYSEDEGRWLVQAVESGVTPDWWQYWIQRYTNILRFKAKFDCADQALDNTVNQIGDTSYNFLALLGFAIKKILATIGIQIKNPLGLKNTYMCSEAVCIFLVECNKLNPALKFIEFDSNDTDPIILINYFRSLPELFEEID